MSSSFTEKPVKYSTYTKEYSKTYENKVSNIKIYYDSKYNDILGFAATYKVGNITKIDKIGNTTSSYFKDINLDDGISYKLNYSDKKIYGKYGEFHFNYEFVNLKTITYRVLNNVYELILDSVSTYFNVLAENPNTDREIFIKTYINLPEVILYLNENGNVIGFSGSITDIIGKSNINDVKKTQRYLFRQFKYIPSYDIYGNVTYTSKTPESNEILPSVNTIIFSISNGIYNVRFPDIDAGFTPIIDSKFRRILELRDLQGNLIKNPNVPNYTVMKIKSFLGNFPLIKTFSFLNTIKIYYDDYKSRIIGFETVGIPETYFVGNTNSSTTGKLAPYTLIDLKNGISFKFNYYGYKVYGNYNDYGYKYKNKLTTIIYKKDALTQTYNLEFNNIPLIENVNYIETPVTNSTKYNKEYNKTYDNKLNYIIINYNSNYNSISGFETEYDAIGIPTSYTKNINLANGISYTLNSIGQKIYGNYNEYPNKFKTVNIKLVMYRFSNGVYEIAFPELFPELKKYF